MARNDHTAKQIIGVLREAILRLGEGEKIGKPVITTNQAALCAVPQTMKSDTPLPGKSRQLKQLPAGRRLRRAALSSA